MSSGGRSSLEDVSEGGGALEGALAGGGRRLRLIAFVTYLGLPLARLALARGIRVASTAADTGTDAVTGAEAVTGSDVVTGTDTVTTSVTVSTSTE